MSHTPPLHCCRLCGSSNYRRILARDAHGARRSTELYRCSGCSVVFADPKAWREGDATAAMAPNIPPGPHKPVGGVIASSGASGPGPNLAAYGSGPPRVNPKQ